MINGLEEAKRRDEMRQLEEQEEEEDDEDYIWDDESYEDYYGDTML
jgi:hypothetical protein